MAESMSTSERSERSEPVEQGDRVISDRSQKFYTENVVTSFEDLNLKETLLRGVYSYGFELPSAIQQKAILPVLDGHDVIGQAQSGTG